MKRSRERSAVGGTATLLALLVLGSASAPLPLHGQSLRGSRASLDRQNRQARSHDFTFLRDRAHVRRFIGAGLLVPVEGDRNYEVHRPSFSYARPEVKVFLERLAAQYRRACGERLVVTSLTRPWSHQPGNGSDRSVHPTGMAVDLRRSNRSACRAWLEGTLLSLEGQGVLEATRERWPPHYHVALFPDPYTAYVDQLQRRAAASGPEPAGEYRVRQGDSLWEIARSHGVSVTEVRLANKLAGSRIYPGQLLTIPAADQAVADRVLSYRVQRGDSLWEIARIHQTTVEEIRTRNGLGGSRIYAGQTLEVPVGR